MRQAQGDFWNTPTGVIRNRNPAPFRFIRRSNTPLRQPPPILFHFIKEHFGFRTAKIFVFSFLLKLLFHASLALLAFLIILRFLSAKLEYHTATYLRNHKNLSKKSKKSCSTQIGCVEIINFAAEISENYD